MIPEILSKLGFASLNDMQNAAIAAADRQDTIILSPTGSGKTLAFLLPMLKRFRNNTPGVQGLIVVPSRELALQIEQVFKAMGTGFKVNCCYGGHPVKTEKNNLSEPPALLIGTPGRLAYHFREQNVDANTVHTLVLDEFDKALEFGFEEDMAFIIGKLKSLSRRILTSATKMEQVPAFTGISKPLEVNFLKDVNIIPDLAVKKIVSPAADKLDTLFAVICQTKGNPSLIFCNHREAVDRISSLLWKMGLDHGVFHGGMEQEDRQKALIKFRNGTYRMLITTDLAARGLDIPEVEFVIHYQLPLNKEAFLHRNGRTARMHAKGTVYIIQSPEENPDYLSGYAEVEELPANPVIPENSPWATLYIGAGKKDKINKMDIVGLFLAKGGLEKDDLGLIEVQDYSSYAAVRRDKIEELVRLISKEKIKNKKVKIEISR